MTKRLTKFSSYFLTFILGAAIGAGVYGIADNLSSKKLDDDYISIERPGGLVLPDEVQGKGVKILSTAISAEQFEDYGIMPTAESATILTATLTPADSDVTDFTWTESFKNEASSWASGKTVSEYVSIQVDRATPLKCTVTCLQAFAEPIEVKITYDNNPSIFATAQLDYVGRIYASFYCSGANPGDAFNLGNIGPTWYLNENYLGVGTVRGELSISRVGAKFSNDFIEELHSDSFYKQWENYIKSVDSDHLTPGVVQRTLEVNPDKYTNVPNKKGDSDEYYKLSFGMYDFINDKDSIFWTVHAELNRSGINLTNYLGKAFYQAISKTSKQYCLEFEYNYTYTVNGVKKSFLSGQPNDDGTQTVFSNYYDLDAGAFKRYNTSLDISINEKNLYL